MGGVVKFADFGLSINARAERPVTRAGTLDYMAPEVLLFAWRYAASSAFDVLQAQLFVCICKSSEGCSEQLYSGWADKS